MLLSGPMKTAFVTGITGQDGSYLAELLLEKGYEVHGMVRRVSHSALGEHSGNVKDRFGLAHADNLFLHYGDLGDSLSLGKCIAEIQPDEVYNLAAMSDVRVSFDIPEYTADVTGLGAQRLFDAVRLNGKQGTRIYQASSSEMFGKVLETPQKETTPFNPQSPYAVAKAYAHMTGALYRNAYGMHITNGILFNHESPRRGPNFVTRKITQAAARIKLGLQEKLYLGNIDARRDWGYAPEYVEAMWRMLQHDTPEDFVVATGETHSVEDFLDAAFSHLDLDWKEYVDFKETLKRPAEVDTLTGDASKAKEKLGWEPKVTFAELVGIMVDEDLAKATQEKK